MPKAQVTECRSRDSGSAVSIRGEGEQARQELALMSYWDPRAGYFEILLSMIT